MADKRLDEILNSTSLDDKTEFIATRNTGAPTPAGYEDFRFNIRSIGNWVNLSRITFTVVLSADSDQIYNGLFVNAIYIGVYSGTRIVNSQDDCFDESGNAISAPTDASYIDSVDYTNGIIKFTSTRSSGEIFTIDVVTYYTGY